MNVLETPMASSLEVFERERDLSVRAGEMTITDGRAGMLVSLLNAYTFAVSSDRVISRGELS
jgi:hypothetical protein